jgi:two-component system response regulator
MPIESILLVESNHRDEMIVLRILRENNFHGKVTVVRDGEEALDYLFGLPSLKRDKNTRYPQLMVLALELDKKVDGIEVLRRIHADPHTCRIPVVILTASQNQEHLVKCYGLGCSALVHKPQDTGELIEAARNIILLN